VQQILRSATSPTRYPPEITRIISLRFTFAVALSQQSYYRQQKTYQVISVVTAFGNQPATPSGIGSGSSGSPGGGVAAQSSSQNDSEDIEEASNAAFSSPLLTAVRYRFLFHLQQLRASTAHFPNRTHIHACSRRLLRLLNLMTHRQ
jgi:hypothetical protein